MFSKEKNLLKRVKEIEDTCIVPERYNILKVLEAYNKEVMMCRILADILNPNGSHRQGNKYLKSFLKQVLNLEIFTEKDLGEVKVHKEYLIENNRRIDIVIENSNYFLPVEVKIHAKDQPSQCYDYYMHARKKCKNPDTTRIVYITIFKHMPSEDSVCSKEEKEKITPAEKIICVSFDEHIRLWMEGLLKEENSIMAEVFRLFIEAIDLFSGRERKEIIMNIATEISLNKENLRSGINIAAAVNQAKAMVMKQLMYEIEQEMKELTKEYSLKEIGENYFYYDEKATEEFYSKYSTYPGINYKVEGVTLGEGLSLWFRIEIEHSLFGGFCVYDEKNKKEVENWHNINLTIPQGLKNDDNIGESWWLWWGYLPTGKCNLVDEIPNFKVMNDAAIELADAEKRKEFVQKTISVIKDEMLTMIHGES